MINEFLDGEAYIRIDREDVPNLTKLHELLDVCFASGERLDDEFMRKIIDEYTTVFIIRHVEGVPNQQNSVYYSITNTYKEKTYTAEQILNEKLPEIEETEFDNILFS